MQAPIMHKYNCNHQYNRRELLSLASFSFGSLALTALSSEKAFGSFLNQAKTPSPLAAKPPHYPPRAKSVIFLYMDGGISQVDSFDPKPRLNREHGQNPRSKFHVEPTQFDKVGKIMQSPWKFKQYGQSGIAVSELFPHIASCADELCVIRSMVAEFPEHTNANYFLHTGSGLQGLPSMGSWCCYGLGSTNENLPGYIVLNGGLVPPGGLDNFNSGFLPASYQGSIFNLGQHPVANITPNEKSDDIQRTKLKHIDKLDKFLLARIGHNDQIESAIANYELAYRMQTAVPDLMDLSSETDTTKKLYGVDSTNKNTANYARQCLTARRLVERGVRFIELTCGNTGNDRWDQHGNLKKGHAENAMMVDQPIAALLKDLKSRGLLDSTLVVFSGEFGRTPFAQGSNGRDHNPQGFTLWLAGGGIRPGTIYGATDEYGYHAVENKVTIHDLHANILHLLGIDHTRLTYRFSGRDIRLTDVFGELIPSILA